MKIKKKIIKDFDCVEMMHRGGKAVQAVTAKMTIQEEAAYWRERTQELQGMIEKARKKRRTA
jgi:hypothetical protein